MALCYAPDMTISERLLPEFDREMASTRKLLERYPEDKRDYKPHEKSMTLARLAGHVAEIPYWATMTLKVQVLDIQPGQQPYTAGSRHELLETFDRNVADARPLIEAASNEDWEMSWTLSFGGRPMFTLLRTDVMRSWVMNHLIHHRAQLGVYLRLNGIEIPGMYGPSADDVDTTLSLP